MRICRVGQYSSSQSVSQSVNQSINQSINQCFYFRNKPITQRQTERQRKLLKKIKTRGKTILLCCNKNTDSKRSGIPVIQFEHVADVISGDHVTTALPGDGDDVVVDMTEVDKNRRRLRHCARTVNQYDNGDFRLFRTVVLDRVINKFEIQPLTASRLKS